MNINGAMSEAAIKASRCKLETGDRVIDDRGESGTLGRETFHGPWNGFKIGFWVIYDRDYATRILQRRLKRIQAPIQDLLFEEPRTKQYD